ncbi:hypothetical protein COLO4_10153 [Corchorus olitorius]|uniref:TIR domain-containing protein n=1 Tax=Corchorus olitorius TaxID=93759 RepID=A0A1R3K9Z8_9ROSI|nr:hypothetical protein COLO4_10153 [Corchorus olitorius]
MECWRSKQQLVVPIFYHVDPSDVRNQTETFGKGFVQHQRKRTEITDKIQRWRDASKEAGLLSGFHLKGEKPEPEEIKRIVVDIINKLNRLSQSDSNNKGLVAVVPKLEQIESLLCIGGEDVRMIGIWGMGGIGKTTLAQAIYDQVSTQFESRYFLANVREEIKKQGDMTVRDKLVSKLLNEANLHIETPTIPSIIKDRLRHKRVLVVLDDVSNWEQFGKLAISHDHFGSGSRIIVTSRDKQVLENGSADAIYEVKGLNDPDSLQLFCVHAFQQNHLVAFRDLSAKFLKYAGGVPIALKVLGKALVKKDRDYWTSKLEILEEHPPKGIFDVLKISFEALETVERDIFLDIACFGYPIADKVLKSCYGGKVDCALSNLVDKCLLTRVDNYFPYRMHDLLREMGQTIVRQESDNPGERSRLWKPDDVRRLLENNLGNYEKYIFWCQMNIAPKKRMNI